MHFKSFQSCAIDPLENGDQVEPIETYTKVLNSLTIGDEFANQNPGRPVLVFVLLVRAEPTVNEERSSVCEPLRQMSGNRVPARRWGVGIITVDVHVPAISGR
jgi:hypothetical protein